MEQQLKQRIVGAIVLVLLAVIFLPMLFEDALQHDRIFETKAPPFPKREFEARLRQMQEATLAAGKRAMAQVSPEPSVPIPSAWVVQVGSFSLAGNAKQMVKQLRQAGFPAFIDDAQGASKKNLFRVLIGPALKKGKAKQWKEELQDKLGLSGFVIAHPVGGEKSNF